jgi:sirohydrochlorin cobaltochelatase
VHGIVLFAHGARDPEWARPFEAMRDVIRRARPECPIRLAYLEIMEPRIGEAVAALVEEGASAITIFPLFMAQGAHLKDDLPRLVEKIRQEHPHIPLTLERALGEVPEVLEAIAGWIVARVE